MITGRKPGNIYCCRVFRLPGWGWGPMWAQFFAWGGGQLPRKSFTSAPIVGAYGNIDLRWIVGHVIVSFEGWLTCGVSLRQQGQDSWKHLVLYHTENSIATLQRPVCKPLLCDVLCKSCHLWLRSPFDVCLTLVLVEIKISLCAFV